MSKRTLLWALVPMGLTLLLACGGGEKPSLTPTAPVGAAALGTAAPLDEVIAALTTIGEAALGTPLPASEAGAALTTIAEAMRGSAVWSGEVEAALATIAETRLGSAASQGEVEEVRAFLDGYAGAIAAGDFEAVVGRYLGAEQVLNMAQGMGERCAGGDGACLKGLIASGELEEIWRSCCSIPPEAARGFRVLQVRRLSADEYLVVYNFFDEDGRPHGVEVHPQWAAGRTMHGFRQPDGSLRCDSYYFFE